MFLPDVTDLIQFATNILFLAYVDGYVRILIKSENYNSALNGTMLGP
jgi:hypothetical protein